MKILFLYAKGNSEITNRQSALGSYMNCLCRLLTKNGYEINFNDISFEKLAGTSASNSNSTPRRNNIPVPRFIKGMIKNYLRLKEIEKLKSSISKSNFKPDLIIEFYNYGSDLGSHFSKGLNCPLTVIYDAPVLEEHEFFNGRSYFYRGKIANREVSALFSAKKIVVYSNAVKKHLMDKTGNSDDTFRIHQNVDYTRFDFKEPKPFSSEMNIGFIGSFLAWHRADLLLEVFENLYTKGIKANLFLIGAGQQAEQIKERIHSLQSKDSIVLTGFLDGNELKEIKDKLHVGVMPGSNWYGAPNKIFEYGAAGMAVIAPDTPTIKDLFVANEDLILFKWNDAVDLQMRLENLLQSSEIYQRISANLHKKIKQNYSEQITFDFYDQLIKSSIKQA